MILSVQQTITITSTWVVNDGDTATFMLAASRSDIINYKANDFYNMTWYPLHEKHYFRWEVPYSVVWAWHRLCSIITVKQIKNNASHTAVIFLMNKYNPTIQS